MADFRGETGCRRWVGRKVYDQKGDEVGTVEELYVDKETRRPEWLAVWTGWVGLSRSFVPIARSSIQDDGIRVGYDTDTIKDAPNVNPGEELSEEQEQRLYRHYGIDYEGGHQAYGTESRADYEEFGEEDAMVLSEEELEVGTRTEETGRVRLHKYVETEEQQVTVPVEKERVRVEREPITGGEASGGITGEDEEEIVLHEERPVVSKETHPVEKVHLEKDVETVEETVSEQVRRERAEIEEEGDVDRR